VRGFWRAVLAWFHVGVSVKRGLIYRFSMLWLHQCRYCVGEFICVLVGKRFCDALGLSVWVCVLAVLFASSFLVKGEGCLVG